MLVVKHFDLAQLIDLSIGVFVAFVLATAIGAERQWRQRSAGLRTNVLVAIGAAAFVSLGLRINGQAGAVQITAYVVSGIGFLGAGVILKDGTRIQGLNTAATLWCSAILAGSTLLRPLVNAINRAPVDELSSEAIYEIHVVTEPDTVGEARDLLTEALERASYPIRQIEVEDRSPDTTEIIATLVSAAVDPLELDAVASELETSPLVSFASWSSSANE
jgi:putative Mg2+ transporter-C (MgtC) family protein